MEKFIEKLVKKQKDNYGQPSVTVAFLGDSVTQGCFDIYQNKAGSFEPVFDKKSAYHTYFAEIFSVLCPNVPVNIINAGISGSNAPHGLERLERDVLHYNPDLVVVCFGLNDSRCGAAGIKQYTDSLAEIFDRLQDIGSEIIFMTPNMMCTDVSGCLKDELLTKTAAETAKIQNAGMLDNYLEAAKALCREKNITVCDCYAKWKRLETLGFDVTELLSNKINHPTREMNWLFAYSLAETILGL